MWHREERDAARGAERREERKLNEQAVFGVDLFSCSFSMHSSALLLTIKWYHCANFFFPCLLCCFSHFQCIYSLFSHIISILVSSIHSLSPFFPFPFPFISFFLFSPLPLHPQHTVVCGVLCRVCVWRPHHTHWTVCGEGDEMMIEKMRRDEDDGEKMMIEKKMMMLIVRKKERKERKRKRYVNKKYKIK